MRGSAHASRFRIPNSRLVAVGIALLLCLVLATGLSARMGECKEGGRYWPFIEAACDNFGINPNLVLAIIHVESNCRPQVCSHANACGIMQLIESTAVSMGVDRNDVRQNIWGGVHYLRYIYDEHGLSACENEEQRLQRLLCSYNAGPHRCASCTDLPDIQETTNYVANVTRLFRRRYGDGGIMLTPSPARPLFSGESEPVIPMYEIRAGDDGIPRKGKRFELLFTLANRGQSSPNGKFYLTFNRDQVSDVYFRQTGDNSPTMVTEHFLQYQFSTGQLDRDETTVISVSVVPTVTGELLIKARFELERAGEDRGSVSYPFVGFLDLTHMPTKQYAIPVRDP